MSRLPPYGRPRILMLDRGKDPDEVADLLGIDHTRVYRYAQSYRSLGLKDYLGDGYQAGLVGAA